MAETGLDIMYELLQNVNRHEHIAQEFYQQFLLQLIGAMAFVQQQLTSGDISPGQPPALVVFQHNSGQPVVTSGRQHPLFQHGAGSQHPGDVAFE